MNGNAGPRIPAGDESSASSSTSSSSRRTYTSTSSQHPLPARPDWAVGLKPQPTLHATHRHHDHSANSRNMSPARPNGQQGPPLQSTDFPPLSGNAAGEKRVAVAGVWNNSSSTRSILTPGNHASGNVVVNHSSPTVGTMVVNTTDKLDEYENALERPATKGSSENVGPKGAWKAGVALSPIQQDKGDKDKERLRGEVVANAILVDKVALLSVKENGSNGTAPVALAT
ncbi:hypothetical protein JVU11DRAFT_6449 [Chiua virens]|nr:hypothetical protein JVU11DRAFT_6449 [Chiua virens]